MTVRANIGGLSDLGTVVVLFRNRGCSFIKQQEFLALGLTCGKRIYKIYKLTFYICSYV